MDVKKDQELNEEMLCEVSGGYVDDVHEAVPISGSGGVYISSGGSSGTLPSEKIADL